MKAIYLLCLLLVSFPLQATRLIIPQTQQAVDLYTVDSVISTEGESFDAFMVRVTMVLTAFTDAKNYEACGNLTQQGDRYAVVLTTNNSHIACVVTTASVEGYAPIGYTVHSHPIFKQFRINENDRVLLGGRISARQQTMRVDHDQHQFSDQDYDRPGYLVAAGNLLFQDRKALPH